MIIKTMAKALTQCRTRTQAGWIVFAAVVAAACCSLTVRVALLSGLTSVSTVPAGSLPKAALVGANTVNGPLPSRVSTRPAAFTAATSVVWSLELTAFWMMFFEGNIAAPPTITVFSCAETGAATVAVRASAANAAADNNAIRFDMDSLPMIELTGGASAGDEEATTTLAGLAASSL